MRAALCTTFASLALALCLARGHQAAAAAEQQHHSSLRLPWKEAGLTERQAAAHLLNRFAFGPRPGEVDEVIAMGLGRWFERQLDGNLPDPNLDARLHDLPALALSQSDLVRVYPNPNAILGQAQKEGVFTKEEVVAIRADKVLADFAKAPGKPGGARAGAGPGPAGAAGAGGAGGAPGSADAAAEAPANLDPAKERERQQLSARLLGFARERGYRPLRELTSQLLAQKIYRAAESQNQLEEVMTDFWFNHFNVSLTNDRARQYLLSYERDAIRPNALGNVRALLEGTARHPAMLLYLDNAQSTAAPNAPTLLGEEMARMGGGPRPLFAPNRRPIGPRPPPPAKKGEQPHGLNENYARELLELHTLGVDGGYTQQDVIEVARAFTGWTVIPAGPAREQVEKRIERVRQWGGLGFQTDRDFLFRADMHDAAPKVILGQRFPAGRGIQDGEAVLDLVAVHPSTARHLATQLAVRFVSDKPPQPLIDRLTFTYTRSRGDVRELLRTIVQTPEFWNRDAVGSKLKSPFELAVSAVRASGAHIEDPRPLLGWVARMGQPLYAYQAPTGYPDRAEAWVNTGSLLNRMNFGLQFAAERVRGVDIDLAALHEGKEPESREEALRTYAALLLPGRDLTPTFKLLMPLLADPGLASRVDQAAPRESPAQLAQKVQGANGGGGEMHGAEGAMPSMPAMMDGGQADAPGGQGRRRGEVVRAFQPQHAPSPLEQVAGLILGSPEFQRR
ncbi:MAG TPA: DUF1800 domain-containing protein [Thermoanaerobaculia bacterium]|nr:DUF1800 domain-containing protein [Thermoanaerobaculia bacterium]